MFRSGRRFVEGAPWPGQRRGRIDRGGGEAPLLRGRGPGGFQLPVGGGLRQYVASARKGGKSVAEAVDMLWHIDS